MYPRRLLQESRIGTGCAKAAGVLIALLPCLPAQQSADTPPLYRSTVDLLPVAVRVTDRKDKEIGGLAADQFHLYEDGVPQKIAFFASGEEPVSLGILLDVSNSMAWTGKLDHAKEALARLIGTLRPGDEVFYLQFHRKVEKIVNFTADPRQILSAIATTGVKQDGTSLYDAIAKALCQMQGARHHKRALLVITDGADQHSHRSLDQLIPIVQASPAQVFVLGYFGPEEYALYRSSKLKVQLVTNQEIDNPVALFRRLANESGAECFFPSSPSKLEEAADAVAHQLRTQYTLAYYPKAERGGFHHIQVKVSGSGLRVRTRRGFGSEPLSGGSRAGCEDKQLRPYAYESKVQSEAGCTLYHDDFQDEASGWPKSEHFQYVSGTYQILAQRVQRQPARDPYAFTGDYGSLGAMGSADPAEGRLAGNGPWFRDFDASISVEVKPTGAHELGAAAGLAFRINEQGYYALIVTASHTGMTRFKLVKKLHAETKTRDLLPWTELPLFDANSGVKKISIRCRGAAVSLVIQNQSAGTFNDSDFPEGLVGMVLYGTGRAVFRDLVAQEWCGTRAPR